MSVRFAGSGKLDGRRRRQLATQAEPEFIPRSSSRKSPKKEIQREDSIENSTVALFPVKKLISPKKWKLWSISFGLVAVCALFLYTSIQVQKYPGDWSPDLVNFFSLENGLLYRSFNSLLVLVSAQLALGIWWARSRSILDFSGQYRTWFTVTFIGLLISFCMATDAHITFSNTISWYWNFQFWKQELLGWAVPLLGCATAVVCSMHIEMRKNRLSLSLFWFSMLIWGCCLSFSFDVGQEYFLEYMTLVKTASFCIGSIFLFASLLFHTQFVVHVDADPPVAQLSLRKRIFNRIRSRKKKETVQETKKTKPARKAKTTTRSKTTVASKSSPAGKKSVAVQKKKAPIQTRTAQTKPVQSKPVAKQPVIEKKTPAKKAIASAAPASFNIDDYYFEPGEPLDHELLKGLSKRERRQLRKQWKESQRAA